MDASNATRCETILPAMTARTRFLGKQSIAALAPMQATLRYAVTGGTEYQVAVLERVGLKSVAPANDNQSTARTVRPVRKGSK